MNFIFKKKKKKEPPLISEIGENTIFEGELTSKNPIYINGKAKGVIKSHISVETGEKSQVDGTICSPSITLKGIFVGTLEAENITVISKSAKIQGEIKTAKIKIENGAVIEGKIR